MKIKSISIYTILAILLIAPMISSVFAADFSSIIDITPNNPQITVGQTVTLTATWTTNKDVTRCEWLVGTTSQGITTISGAQSGTSTFDFSSNTEGVYTITFKIWHHVQYANGRIGEESEQVTVTATVVYKFSGFFAPLVEDGYYKAGSTIPVKFQILDSEDSPVTDVEVVNICFVADATGTNAPETNADVIALPDAPATGGTQFRYDYDAEQYVFNLKTPKGVTGTYYIVVVLSDGVFENGLSFEYIQINLK